MRWRTAVAIVLAAAILGAAAVGALSARGIDGLLELSLFWTEALQQIGWFAFAMLQVMIVASGVLPASLAGIAAGALFGITVGFVVAGTATMAGAVITLLLARTLARGWVERFVARHGRLMRLDGLFAQDGLRMVVLLRLSPVMPFAATSYALGLSSVSVRDYLLGTTASLPALLGYVALGWLGASGVSGQYTGWFQWSILGVGVLATGLLTLKLGTLLIKAGLVPQALRDRLADRRD